MGTFLRAAIASESLGRASTTTRSTRRSSSTSTEGWTASPAPVRSAVRAARTTRWNGRFRDQLPYRGSV